MTALTLKIFKTQNYAKPEHILIIFIFESNEILANQWSKCNWFDLIRSQIQVYVNQSFHKKLRTINFKLVWLLLTDGEKYGSVVTFDVAFHFWKILGSCLTHAFWHKESWKVKGPVKAQAYVGKITTVSGFEHSCGKLIWTFRNYLRK